MITIKEIRQRLMRPYKHEAPYYIHRGKFIGGKAYDVTLNWYEVHGNSPQQDILDFIAQLPKELQDWIMPRITYEKDTTRYIDLDTIFSYIDVAHFGYYGYFAE